MFTHAVGDCEGLFGLVMGLLPADEIGPLRVPDGLIDGVGETGVDEDMTEEGAVIGEVEVGPVARDGEPSVRCREWIKGVQALRGSLWRHRDRRGQGRGQE